MMKHLKIPLSFIYRMRSDERTGDVQTISRTLQGDDTVLPYLYGRESNEELVKGLQSFSGEDGSHDDHCL